MSKYSQKIPEVQKISNAGDLLPDSVVDYPIKNKEECFKISFEKYNNKKCEIKNLECSPAKKALAFFRDVGNCTSQEEIYRLGKGDHVKNAQNYSFLFDNLDEDVDMREYRLSGESRLFYYVDDAKKEVNCILLKNSHL